VCVKDSSEMRFASSKISVIRGTPRAAIPPLAQFLREDFVNPRSGLVVLGQEEAKRCLESSETPHGLKLQPITGGRSFREPNTKEEESSGGGWAKATNWRHALNRTYRACYWRRRWVLKLSHRDGRSIALER